MNGWRLSHHFGKILFLAVFAPLLAVIAALILFRADVLSAQGSSTLNCYDSAGNYESCATRASASPSPFNGRTTREHQLASWTATALYQQATWTTTAVDQPANWTTNAVDQPANWTTNAVDQPADRTTSALVARRSITSGKHAANCRRRLMPCFLSALRRGFTHIASVAATMGQARPARERL
jgi:hypothetical protein